ncbi:beta-ketoacyl synthase [Roseateles sp. SL47]|uniref:beta-ketoacyl synthase n=1 Tax=Roseateles sp. SL47 TaxID=2995138 RepID=UPI00227144B7|nr:beta-ketoacyl synthase [Roseateles sp. SL47]WAC71149.1 beta-ketoacyl synthase [Roseateles sp. SL47]
MSTDMPLWLLAASCCFPSGPTIALADAALRAQLRLTRRHPSYRDRAGVPAQVSSFPDPEGRIEGSPDAHRWGWLARHALAQLTTALAPHWESLLHRPRWLWLVLPDEHRPGVPADLPGALRQAMTQDLWPWSKVHVVRGGHAAGLLALEQARNALREASKTSGAAPPLAVVLATDAATDAESLAWLDAQNLLHGAYVHRPAGPRALAHGRVPGEGAAALALMTAPEPSGFGAPPWARLLGCSTALEPTDRHGGRPCVGAGLSGAARNAMAQAGSSRPPIGLLFSDLNGEPYRADEFGFTALRLGPDLRDGWQRKTPAIVSGDLHGASGVANLAMAAYQLSKLATGQGCLVLSSSDDSLRGAALLASAGAGSNLPMEVQAWR